MHSGKGESAKAKTVLVAGSTGYLGKFAVRAFKQRGYRVRALTRSEERLAQAGPFTAPAVAEWVDEVFVGEITKPETLDGLMDGVDFVFSSIGISRQRDGLTFEQVDHQANRLLIDFAKKAGCSIAAPSSGYSMVVNSSRERSCGCSRISRASLQGASMMRRSRACS